MSAEISSCRAIIESTFLWTASETTVLLPVRIRAKRSNDVDDEDKDKVGDKALPKLHLLLPLGLTKPKDCRTTPPEGRRRLVVNLLGVTASSSYVNVDCCRLGAVAGQEGADSTAP